MPTRSGRYIEQIEGYKAFIPESLPPSPSINWDDELKYLLSKADRALGRLDGIASFLPNPDLFVAMYVRKEAVLSSQIEGTQASLIDIFDYETTGEEKKDVDEIVNYINAMNHGLELLEEIPISLRLIKEIHEVLLRGVRGQHRAPGEFRTSQNWIGPQGGNINDATYVPPPPHEMKKALGDLEKFIHEETRLPVLVKNALIHAQFETIHPFLDGNGRIGRLLITFLLMERDVLKKPLLYLSYYLKKYRSEYYEWLNKIRFEGDWEGWIKFFLDGVYEVSQQAIETAQKIVSLQEQDRDKVKNNANTLQLLDRLYYKPMVTSNTVRDWLDVSTSTANRLLNDLEETGILKEITGFTRNRKYIYNDYLNIMQEGTEMNG